MWTVTKDGGVLSFQNKFLLRLGLGGFFITAYFVGAESDVRANPLVNAVRKLRRTPILNSEFVTERVLGIGDAQGQKILARLVGRGWTREGDFLRKGTSRMLLVNTSHSYVGLSRIISNGSKYDVSEVQSTLAALGGFRYAAPNDSRVAAVNRELYRVMNEGKLGILLDTTGAFKNNAGLAVTWGQRFVTLEPSVNFDLMTHEFSHVLEVGPGVAGLTLRGSLGGGLPRESHFLSELFAFYHEVASPGIGIRENFLIGLARMNEKGRYGELVQRVLNGDLSLEGIAKVMQRSNLKSPYIPDIYLSNMARR